MVETLAILLDFYGNIIIDGSVKSRETPISVIPEQAGHEVNL